MTHCSFEVEGRVLWVHKIKQQLLVTVYLLKQFPIENKNSPMYSFFLNQYFYDAWELWGTRWNGDEICRFCVTERNIILCSFFFHNKFVSNLIHRWNIKMGQKLRFIKIHFYFRSFNSKFSGVFREWVIDDDEHWHQFNGSKRVWIKSGDTYHLTQWFVTYSLICDEFSPWHCLTANIS